MALELEPGSSLEQVKEQYRRLAKENHPDLNPQNRMAFEDRLRQLNAAYAILSDPHRKAILDLRWEREQAAPIPGGARVADRPTTHPRPPGPIGPKHAKSKAARKPTRPLTREERKRVRVAAASIGLAISISVVATVYSEWTQPPPQNRAGVAPSLGGSAFDSRTEASSDSWPPLAPIPMNPPPPAPASESPTDAALSGDLRIQQIKQVLQRRMDDVEPKITALALAAQSAANVDSKSPGASPQRLQWRTQLTADAREMLIQRSTVRLEIDDLSWSDPKMQQNALKHIKSDSQRLDEQYRNLNDNLRLKPL